MCVFVCVSTTTFTVSIFNEQGALSPTKNTFLNIHKQFNIKIILHHLINCTM